jgi:hypothetical protein
MQMVQHYTHFLNNHELKAVEKISSLAWNRMSNNEYNLRI